MKSNCASFAGIYLFGDIFDLEFDMASANTRWNLVVSKETDQSLRQFLASTGGCKKSDLSRFVEDAANKHIFDSTLKAMWERNANVPPQEIEEAIEESLAWARAKLADADPARQ